MKAVILLMVGMAAATFAKVSGNSCKEMRVSAHAYEDANCTIEATEMTSLYNATYEGLDFTKNCIAYEPNLSFDYLCKEKEFVTQFYHGSTECPGDASQQISINWDTCTKDGRYYIKLFATSI